MKIVFIPFLFILLTFLTGCAVNTRLTIPGKKYYVWGSSQSNLVEKNENGKEQYIFNKDSSYTINYKEKPSVNGKYVIDKRRISDAATGNVIFDVKNIGGEILHAKKPDGTKIFCKTEKGSQSIYGSYIMTYEREGETRGSVMGGNLQVWKVPGYLAVDVTENKISLEMTDRKTGKTSMQDTFYYERWGDLLRIPIGIDIQMYESYGVYSQAKLSVIENGETKFTMMFKVEKLKLD